MKRDQVALLWIFYMIFYTNIITQFIRFLFDKRTLPLDIEIAPLSIAACGGFWSLATAICRNNKPVIDEFDIFYFGRTEHVHSFLNCKTVKRMIE